MIELTAKPFDWNDNMSEIAQEDFSQIQKSLSYGTAMTIGMALAKLELLEKQGCKVEPQENKKGESMTFKVIDTKTGKEPTDRVIHNIAKKGGLLTMDIDQFFVGEDGSLILADDCGNITYCDTKRFMVEPQEVRCEI